MLAGHGEVAEQEYGHRISPQSDLGGVKVRLVGQEGFEPSTDGLEG